MSSQAALAGTPLPDNLRVFVADPEGAGSYPIVTYTWLLLYKSYDKPTNSAALKEVIRYCLGEGQAVSESLGRVPLPPNVVASDLKALDAIK